MNYRQLDSTEITALKHQGCFSSDWSAIGVSDQFSTDSIRNVWFEGEVKLGKLGGEIVKEGAAGARPSKHAFS